MRVARVENGKVTALWEVPSLDCYGSEVLLVEVGSVEQIGWDYDGTGFSAPAKTPDELAAELAAAKIAKVAQIERDRDAQRYANVTAHGRVWQADKISQDLLGDVINLASNGLPLPPAWRDADNSNMAITALPELLAIAGAMAAQTQTAYGVSWLRKAAVDAAVTVEDVEAA